MIKNLDKRVKRKLKYYLERLKNISKKKVLVLGDSHVAVFNYINKNYDLPYFFEVGYVSGATSLGVANPNSKTNALKIFRNKINKTSKKTPIIIQLGEVDCGFVIWFLAQKKNTTVEEQFIKSIKNYQNFIQEELLNNGFENLSIMSATLPTLKDNIAEAGEIANLRKEVTASQVERTKLTLRYNKEMKAFCEANKIQFLDFDPILLGDNGIIKSTFLNSDPLDHHNDDKPYSKVIVEYLKKLKA